jgi:hypothetical protein
VDAAGNPTEYKTVFYFPEYENAIKEKEKRLAELEGILKDELKRYVEISQTTYDPPLTQEEQDRRIIGIPEYKIGIPRPQQQGGGQPQGRNIQLGALGGPPQGGNMQLGPLGGPPQGGGLQAGIVYFTICKQAGDSQFESVKFGIERSQAMVIQRMMQEIDAVKNQIELIKSEENGRIVLWERFIKLREDIKESYIDICTNSYGSSSSKKKKVARNSQSYLNLLHSYDSYIKPSKEEWAQIKKERQTPVIPYEGIGYLRNI